MSENYLIPQFVLDYVYRFTDDKRFKRDQYLQNFSIECEQWLNTTPYSKLYLFYAVRKGNKSLPVRCIICNKPLAEQQIKSFKLTGKYCSCKCAGADTSVLQKRIETNLNRYGAENVMYCAQLVERQQQAIIQKYGSFEQMNELRMAKSRRTCLERYGTPYVTSTKQMHEKAKETYQERYGCDHYLQRVDLRTESIEKIHKNKRKNYYNKFLQKLENKNLQLLSSYDYYVDSVATDNKLQYKCLTCGTIFETIESNPKQLYCPTCVATSKSTREKQLRLMINQYCKTHNNIRSINTHYELDVYSEDYNVAFEYNGLYFHSTYKHEKDYHINKSKTFNSLGISVIHVFEYDFVHHLPAVENNIKLYLQQFGELVCGNVDLIAIDEYNKFVNTYCFKNPECQYHLGLWNNDNLIAVAGYDVFEDRIEIKQIMCSNALYDTCWDQKLIDYIKINHNAKVHIVLDYTHFDQRFLTIKTDIVKYIEPIAVYVNANGTFQQSKTRSNYEIYDCGFVVLEC